jgi:hypothetical protein
MKLVARIGFATGITAGFTSRRQKFNGDWSIMDPDWIWRDFVEADATLM